jgi:hypothetical protein
MSEILRSFRRNAVHVRHALDALHGASGPVGVDGGYLRADRQIERFKQLSIPVRRALNAHDRASFAEALRALGAPEAGVAPDTLAAITRKWTTLQQELDTTVGLGGGKVPRRAILAGWLDAAAFYDRLERDRAYDRLIEQWGTAAEGIGTQFTEEAAHLVLLLDEAAAATLGEPVILPPPPKTPPPPPDPKEPWWIRLRQLWKKGPDDI